MILFNNVSISLNSPYFFESPSYSIQIIINDLSYLFFNELFKPHSSPSFFPPPSSPFPTFDAKPQEEDPKVEAVAERCLKPSELKTHPEKFSPLASLMKKELAGRARIHTMRSQVRELISSENTTGEKGREIGKVVANETRALLKELFQDAEKAMERTTGKRPPCPYSPIVVGSLSRNDGGPYPDIDLFLLVEKNTPENRKYFQKLFQHVGDRLHRLGEEENMENHGLHACFGGATPLFKNYGWRFSNPNYLKGLEKSIQQAKTPEEKDKLLALKEKHLKVQNELHASYSAGGLNIIRGTSTFIATPSEFASWASPNKAKTAKELAEKLKDLHDISPNMLETHIKNAGDYCEFMAIDSEPSKQKLLNNFIHERRRILTDTTTPYAVKIKNQNGDPISVTCKTRAEELFAKKIPSNATKTLQTLPTNGIIDVKKDLWRFPQTLISYLSQMHSVHETDTFERIKALEKKGVFTKETATKLTKTYQFLVTLRAKCQMHYKSEIHETFSSEKAKEDFILKKETALGETIESALSRCKKKIDKLQDPLGSERKKLFEELRELNLDQALKNGLVLTAQEKENISQNVIPFLNELQSKVFSYVEEGMGNCFG